MSRIETAGMLLTGSTNHRRHLVLQGATNLRDIGGYPTLDGRTVRWNILYRSDALHKLTGKDLQILNPLGIEIGRAHV